VTTWRDGVERQVGRGSGRRGHMYAYGQFMLMYGKKPSQHCKVIIIQFKKKYSLKELIFRDIILKCSCFTFIKQNISVRTFCL